MFFGKKISSQPEKLTFRHVITYLVIFSLLSIGIYFQKRVFAVLLFMYLNYFILSLKLKYGIDSPLEVITFATFFSSYAYGVAYGIIVSLSSLVAITLAGRANFYKLFTNVILVLIAVFVPFLKQIPFIYLGIFVLAFRYVVDILYNLVVRDERDYIRKLPAKALNLLFWLYFYLNFGEIFYSLVG